MPQTRNQFYSNQQLPRENCMVNGIGKSYYKGPDCNESHATYYNINTGTTTGYSAPKQDGRTYGGNIAPCIGS